MKYLAVLILLAVGCSKREDDLVVITSVNATNLFSMTNGETCGLTFTVVQGTNEPLTTILTISNASGATRWVKLPAAGPLGP